MNWILTFPQIYPILIYGSLCGYSKSGFEASLLAMDIVNESILELEITKLEDTI